MNYRKHLSHSLFILSLCLCFSLNAQVVIEQDDISIDFGTAKTYYEVSNPDGIEVDLGNAGEDQTWDFREMIFEDFSTDSILNPEQVPGIEDFEGTDRVIRSGTNMFNFQGINESYIFQQISEEGLLIIGQTAVNAQDNPFNFPLDFTENPIQQLPLPAEYEAEWDLGSEFRRGFEAPDTLGMEAFDSVYVVIEIGGQAQIDAWGTAIYSGGEVPVLRQHISIGGHLNFIGVRTIFGRRVELELPIGYDIESSQIYIWTAPEIGEIARITSLPLEENRNFDQASSVRILFLPPALSIPGDEIDFGEVNIGGAGVGTMSLRNEGVGEAIISEIEIDEDLQDELETITELPLSIATDEVAEIRFLWQPQQERNLGDRSVRLFHNDPAHDNPLDIQLSGQTPSGINDGYPVHPSVISLLKNYPNPFNAETRISFELMRSETISIDILNLSGKHIQTLFNGDMTTGRHNITWNARTQPDGIYVYRLRTESETRTGRMVLIR